MDVVGYKIHPKSDAPPVIAPAPDAVEYEAPKIIISGKELSKSEIMAAFAVPKQQPAAVIIPDTSHSPHAITLDAGENYTSLATVLQRAFDQASAGKGNERHATGQPFEAQPMQTISELVGSHDGLLFQAMKKIQESQRLPHDAAVRELLGAINYIAGAIIYREAKMNKKADDEPR